MTSQTMTAEIFGGGDDTVKSYRGWITFAGIALLAAGAMALIYDVTATRASVLAFGWLLMLAGATQIVHAFRSAAGAGSSCICWTASSARPSGRSSSSIRALAPRLSPWS